MALNPPIPVVNGQVNLGPGTYVIRWSATDGVNTATATQTVTVAAGIEASLSFLLDDRSTIKTPGGGFAAVLNAGGGQTKVGQDVRSGGGRQRRAGGGAAPRDRERQRRFGEHDHEGQRRDHHRHEHAVRERLAAGAAHPAGVPQPDARQLHGEQRFAVARARLVHERHRERRHLDPVGAATTSSRA